jgi:hypothetical protein
MPNKTRGKWEEDELTKHLVADPQTVPGTIFMVGFMGKTNRADHVRLYLTPELDEYIEFRSDDLRQSQSLTTAENPLGGTAVWVDRSARIIYTKTISHEFQGEFLRGAIATEFLAKATTQGLSAPLIMTLLARQRIKSIPPVASVCFSCPTEGGEDTCVPATCTLSTRCRTQFLCL